MTKHHRLPSHTYTLLVPLEQFERSFRGGHERWPRHVTLLRDVSHVGTRHEVVDAVHDVTKRHKPFTVTFGPQHCQYGDRPAQDVTNGGEELRALHADLLETLLDHHGSLRGVDLVYTERGEGYSPHCSGEVALATQERIGVWTVLLLMKFAKGVDEVGDDGSIGSVKEIARGFRLGAT